MKNFNVLSRFELVSFRVDVQDATVPLTDKTAYKIWVNHSGRPFPPKKATKTICLAFCVNPFSMGKIQVRVYCIYLKERKRKLHNVQFGLAFYYFR